MTAVDIYTQPRCGFCTAAIRLLTQRGAQINEIDVSKRPGARAEMMQRASGRHTTPQIFIGKTHLGGCDDLFALQSAGKLDSLLKG